MPEEQPIEEWRVAAAAEPASRAVPFRTNLLVNLCAVVLLLGLVLFVTSYIANQSAVEDLSESLTERVIALTDAKLVSFFEPVIAAMEISRSRAGPGDFDDIPVDALDSYFKPIIVSLPQLSSLMYSNDSGTEYMLLSSAGVWKSRLSRPEEWGDRVLWREWRDGEEKLVEEREVAYDARVRPWHIGALERREALGTDAALRDRIHWTQPYHFFTTKEPGVTASLAFETGGGELALLGFDILLSDISKFTTNLTTGKRGKVFVMRGSPQDPRGAAIIGLPADARFEDEEQFIEFVLQTPEEFGGPVGDFSAQGGFDEPGAHPFESGGERWWGAATRSTLQTSEEIWVGSVVPEAELLEGLPDTNLAVAIATLVVIALAVLRSIRLSRLYATPLVGLARSTSRMQRLDFQPGETVPSRITEIRQLGATLESVRQSLEKFSSVREDTRVARSIRDMVIPAAPGAPQGVQLALWHAPSEDVDGELADVVEVGDGTWALLLTDMEGTGVRCAVDGAQLRAAFRMAVRAGRPGATATTRVDLPILAAELADFVARDLPGCGAVRAWLGLLDPAAGTLRTLDLGYETLLHRQGSDGTCRRLPVTAGPLGSDGEPPVVTELRLAPGDVVVLASDGIVEALDGERQRLGVDGLADVLADRPGADATAIAGAIRSRLDGFPTGRRRDRTLLVLRADEGDGPPPPGAEPATP